jgi:predicted aldo/keto reductase-like oxidoreductase
MKEEKAPQSSRRQFLKKACGAGVGMAAGVSGLSRAWAITPTGDDTDATEMPLRPFGNSGVKVPILGLGGSLNFLNRQLLLGQALKMGVRYWDTADNYSGGRSEEGIGAYFSKHPEDRKHVFLVTKTGATSPEGMERSLEDSLKRLKTDHVDLYLLHGLSRVEGVIDDVTRGWVEKTKADGRIRLFGFSTHRNMAACLAQAARLGWLDGIMLTYNYRLMADEDMTRAVDACVRAGIGLIAMKTQGRALSFGGGGRGEELMQHFLDRGLTKHQARLKAVWENPQISGICSHMDNMTILKENVTAARDRTLLGDRDRRLLKRHARRTASAYCAGCGDICESRLDDPVPVADVMRCLMYAHSYNDYQMARETFARLPSGIRSRLVQTDFSAAEELCPQRIAIGEVMRRAAEDLG